MPVNFFNFFDWRVCVFPGISAITTLMVLSFERYVMISKPFQARHLSQRGAGLMIVAIWAYSLVVTTPPIFGWGQYINEAANIR